jgi:hypothetical protein
MDSMLGSNKAVVFPFCELFLDGANRTVRGLSVEFYRYQGQAEPRPVDVALGPYSRVSGSTLGPVQGYGSTPDFPAGENVVTFLVRRRLPNLGTTAEWSMRSQYLGTDTPMTNYFISGEADAHAPFDAQAMTEIAIGVFGGSGDMDVDIARLRILSVP